jgi:hypothetical protein
MKSFLATVACCLLGLAASAPAGAAVDDFGIASLTASLTRTQAGDHPDFTTRVEFATDPNSPPDSRGLHDPYTSVESVALNLPPGLLGNPNAVVRCTLVQFTTPSLGCSRDSQVGIVALDLYGFHEREVVPLYVLDSAESDSVAQLGFQPVGAPVIIDASVRSSGDYGVSVLTSGLPALGHVVAVETKIWGIPAASSHDAERLPTPGVSGLGSAPFMTNPTRCGPIAISATATTYQMPGRVTPPVSADLGEINGCGRLSFGPSFSATPTSRAASSPSGLDAELDFPQNEFANGLAEAQLRSATVTLPNGVTVAPGAADGLAGCSAEQVRLGTVEPARCPPAAKIGSVDIDVPDLPSVLHGALYQRTPEPGRLLGVWLVADELGVHLKLPGQVSADPSSGQLTAVFDGTPQSEGNPQVPVRSFELHFNGGQKGVLATPDACGTYATQFAFVPWSRQAVAAGTTPMSFDERCIGGGLAPRLDAGATEPVAGAFSPFVTTLTREDGEQNLLRLDVALPPGALAKLAGVPLCTEAAAATGACGTGSRVGAATVATGPGSSPLWIPQPDRPPTAVYLAGPYRGAPYSLVVSVPAQAGPFDLGTVVTRAGLYVDPETAQVTAKTDPLPQILQGIPLAYRTISINIDRPAFTLNPTGCSARAVRATVTAPSGGAVTASSRFQVSGCSGLGFRPRLSTHIAGATRRGAYPRLRATVIAGPGEANIARAEVTLPHSEFLAQQHIRTVCTRVQFSAGQCPTGSVYGFAKAWTPLLDKPLAGPVYLRSNGGERELPDLVAALRGGEPSQPLEIDLLGFIDSVRSGLRARFESVPDAPVSKFSLAMRGGARGLLVNSTDLCRARSGAAVKLQGQNGRWHVFRTSLKVRCGRSR